MKLVLATMKFVVYDGTFYVLVSKKNEPEFHIFWRFILALDVVDNVKNII